MEPSAIISLAQEIGKVLNNILERIPTHEQRKMDEFYKFLDMYNQEVAREDRDHDDIVTWKKRKDLLIETIIKQLMEGR